MQLVSINTYNMSIEYLSTQLFTQFNAKRPRIELFTVFFNFESTQSELILLCYSAVFIFIKRLRCFIFYNDCYWITDQRRIV